MIPTAPNDSWNWPALALTVLMHALLLVVLFFGVQWKRTAPEYVEVELWSERPQVAQVAPPPSPPEPEAKPEPRPEPKVEPKPVEKPDIAVAKKKEEKKPEPPKAEPKKPEAKKPETKKADKPAEPSWKDALAQEDRQRELSREASREADRAARDQRAAAAARGIAAWTDKIRGKIRGNIFTPPNLQGNPAAVFIVTLLPSGEVLKVELKRGSGNSAWDSAAERGIHKSSPLPKPDDPSVFDRELKLTLCPDIGGCR